MILMDQWRLHRGIVWALTTMCCLYYFILITNGDLDPWATEPLGSIFNAMAWNLLHWRFTIDPEVVGREAFIFNGQTYSYFGIFPALLRV